MKGGRRVDVDGFTGNDSLGKVESSLLYNKHGQFLHIVYLEHAQPYDTCPILTLNLHPA